MPQGNEQVPIVVMVHGAEHDSALVDYFLQRMLPAEGVGAFVYDKRGTGKSGGHYTQDYSLLADDAVAALRKARQLAGTRVGRIGYQGGSQGGWVAPIAANRAAVDFVIVCFGLAVNVIDEDQESVELQMREKGYPPEVIGKALEVASAAEAVFESNFKSGFEKLDEMRAKYGSAPWYKDVHGDWAWLMLQYSDAELRARAAEFDWHVPFHYDPMPTLRADKVPQLWVLGGEDYEAPSAETSRRIKSLIGEGLPFTLAYYPGAEHGMTLFETGADGERISTRYAPGYFRMMRDFARDGRLRGSYGDAELTTPASPVASEARTLHGDDNTN
jgi:dienelactone hydrolase